MKQNNPVFQTLAYASNPLQSFLKTVTVTDTLNMMILTAVLIAYAVYIYTYILGWLYDDNMSGEDCQREVLKFLYVLMIMMGVADILATGVTKSVALVVPIVGLVINSIIYNWLVTEPFDPNSGVRDMMIALQWINIFIMSLIVLGLLGLDVLSVISVRKRK